MNLGIGGESSSYINRMRLQNRIVYDMKAMGLIYFAEWAEYGTLEKLLINRVFEACKVKILLFQTIYTLAVIQREYPSWRHNDFHPGNLLIQKVEMANMRYQFIGNNFMLPETDMSIKFWDYDIADAAKLKMLK